MSSYRNKSTSAASAASSAPQTAEDAEVAAAASADGNKEDGVKDQESESAVATTESSADATPSKAEGETVPETQSVALGTMVTLKRLYLTPNPKFVGKKNVVLTRPFTSDETNIVMSGSGTSGKLKMPRIVVQES